MENKLHFGLGKHLPLILQTEASECGLACIAMIASFHGHGTDLSDLRKRFPISLKGATLEQLISITDQMGMVARPLRLDLESLSQLQTPAILHWNLNHFIVLKSVKGNIVNVHDPAIGEVRMPVSEVSKHFTGVALELVPGINFLRKPPPPPAQVGDIVGRIVGLKRGLAQLLMLALTLEALALLLPMITQWITDDAIVGGDGDLLTLLGIGLVATGLSMSVIGAVRSWIGLFISTNFNLQLMSNIMGHLLKLPVGYFERRHLGDIVSRFGAVRAIEHSLTNAAVDAALDGLLAIGTLVMMLIYSPKLAAITLSAVALYGALRWTRYSGAKLAQTGAVAKTANEQSYFLETIRGVRSIKLNNKENDRRTVWMNLLVNSTNAGLTYSKMNMFFSVSWSFLATLERAGVFWMGAREVILHNVSLGMLFAFLSYKEQFSGRVNLLIERYIDFKMLSVQTERLADIVLSAPEESFDYRKHDMPNDLTISFERVSYRYATEDALLLDKATLDIAPGECIAIVGPSGCGKTTCVKLLLGILRPTSGKIKIGGASGVSIHQLGLRNYRNLIGTVMQDDQLFAGSLLDNICFLETKPDEKWMHACAKTAGVHDEIVEMPMGYHTLVGDMGTVLSGGQKQRILLARALYRRPKILFLDEATSHLDIENEKKIAVAIASLNITRIMVAHRPQTIAIADRVLRLDKGKFIEVPRGGGSASIDENDVMPLSEQGHNTANIADFERALSL